MELFTSVLEYEDANGKTVTVRKPSVWKTEEFRARFADLAKELKREHVKDISFGKAYVENKHFRKTVDKVFKAVDINPKNLSMDMMVQMLFGHTAWDEHEDEVFVPTGGLIQFIFGEVKKGPINSLSKDETKTLADVFGNVWAHTQNFNDAIQMLKTFGYEDLNAVLSARNWAMAPPEERMKANQKKASRKLLENLKAGKLTVEKPKQTTTDEPLSDSEVDKFFA